jgi:hypothetical protein
MFRDQPSGPHLLARWSFHTPRQEIGSGKPAGGRGRNDLRGWRLPLGARAELLGRGLHTVWA